MAITQTILIGLLIIYLSANKAHTAKMLSVRRGRMSARAGIENVDNLPIPTANPAGRGRALGSLQDLLSDGGNIGQVRRGLSNQARRAGNRRNKVTGSGTRRTGNSPSRRAHPNGRRIPQHGRRSPRPSTSRYVNWTNDNVRQNYPWIQNPRIDNNERRNHRGGRFRFNNLNYLRDRLQGMNKDDYTFRARNGVKAGNGKYKVRIEQKWRSIPVYGAAIVVDQEEDADIVLDSAEGEFLTGIEQDIASEHPSISEPEAIRAKAMLVVDTVGGVATLVYIVDYFVPDSSNGAPDLDLERKSRRPYTKLDANSGSIVKTWDGLTGLSRHRRSTPNIQLSLVNIIEGNPVYGYKRHEEDMYRDVDTDNCYYQTPLGGGHFMRVNDRTTSLTANVIRFPCPEATKQTYDTDRSNGSLSPRNAAFKWGIETIRFLKNVTANVWDWDLNIEVHHPGIIARWTGGKVELGDGDSYQFYAMSTPDTVVHEIGHAFTEHTSGLVYSGESGAINEAYSDMAATAFLDKFFQYPSPSVYQIGRLAIRTGKFLRDMCNPRSSNALRNDGAPPVIVTQNEYTPTTELHSASSLYNKAFCTLSKKATWNIQSAYKVFSLANTVYWKPTETFNSGACGVMKSAFDFFTRQAVNDVIDAFERVGVRCGETDLINFLKRIG